MVNNKTLLVSVILIFFMGIACVGASDVSDISNNPISNDNSSQIVDSNSNTNQISNSSNDGNTTSNIIFEQSNNKNSNNILSSSNILSDSQSISESNTTQSNNKIYSLSSEKYTVSNSSKINTNISDSGSAVYQGDYFTITLIDSSNNKLSGQSVSIDISNGINNKTYFLTTDANGSAGIQVNLGLNTYVMTYSFTGNDNYESSQGSTNLTVLDGIHTKISVVDSTVTKGNNLTVLLTDINGNPLSNQQVNIIFAKGSKSTNPYVITTNSEGKANIQINLGTGSYTTYYNYVGNSLYRNVSGSAIITIVDESISKVYTKISSTDLTINTSYANVLYNVTLKTTNNNSISGQYVNIIINGVTFNVLTNSNGVASVYIPSGYSSGTYSIKYNYVGNANYTSCNGSNTLTVTDYSLNKTNSILTVNNLSMIQGEGNNITAVLTDINGNPIANQYIIFTLSKGTASINYTIKTDNNGIASLQINFGKGEYYVKYYFAGNSNYNPSSATSGITISVPKTPTSIISSNLTMYYGSGQSYTATLMDVYGNELANKMITLTFTKSSGSSFSYNYETDENGIINIPIGLAVGTYSIQASFAGDSVYSSTNGSINSITVKSAPASATLTIAQIVTAATYIRDYVTANAYLPTNVTINSVTYTIGDVCYYIAQALVNINDGSFSNVTIKDIDAAPNPAGDSISGQYNTTKLINVAIKVVNFVNLHGYDPNYVNTTLGSMSFNDYTYAMSKTLIFYSENGRFPNYVVISSSSVNGGGSSSNTPTTQFISGLNEKNNGADVSQYYVNSSSWKCNSQSSTIIALATKLTTGLTSEWDKATAIFNYVRDSISYSYYSNSVKGAVGTLTAGKGNCVDQASLVIALSRAAGLAARYCHGQGCTFTSGLVTGHVWAQILVGDTWYSADPTSIRNSLGNVKNWNVNSFYSLNKYYLVPF